MSRLSLLPKSDKAASYRTRPDNGGEVLYDNRWIPALEWEKKMGHVLR